MQLIIFLPGHPKVQNITIKGPLSRFRGHIGNFLTWGVQNHSSQFPDFRLNFYIKLVQSTCSWKNRDLILALQ